MTDLFLDPPRPSLRYRSRHVQQSVSRYLQEQLRKLGWVNAPINFGTTPATFMEFPPDEKSTKDPIPPNRIAITLGDEPDELEEQLGGGLTTVRYRMYADIFGEKYSISRSIGGDIHDVLTDMAIPVYDWSDDPPVQHPGAWIEFDNVIGPNFPENAGQLEGFRKYWRVVSFDALTTWSEPT